MEKYNQESFHKVEYKRNSAHHRTNDNERPPYHSFERVQNRAPQPQYDARSTMDSILRGQAKFAADDRRSRPPIQRQGSTYYEQPTEECFSTTSYYAGGYEIQPPNPWEGLQLMAPEISGLSSTSSSFLSAGSGSGPNSFGFNRYSSRNQSPPLSSDLSAFNNRGSDYCAYSRDELYGFPQKSPTWPSAPGGNMTGFPVKSPPAARQQTHRNSTPPDGYIYQVQFKRAHKNYILAPSAPRDIIPGDFVKVEADRGEDMGIVLAKIPVEAFEEVTPTAGYRGRGFSSGQGEKKYLFRLASHDERASLVSKVEEEEHALETIREKANERGFPMQILDAEYQFDRHKLTFYFEAERRIDFRELVSELFSQYKTRIWMQQVDTSSISSHDAGTELAKATGFLPDREEQQIQSKRSSFSQGDDTTKDGSVGGSVSLDQHEYLYGDEPQQPQFGANLGCSKGYVEYYDRTTGFVATDPWTAGGSRF